MKFSLAILTCLASSMGVMADLHKELYCADDHPATSLKHGETVTANNNATILSCQAYRVRDTGTNQWDTCPDCEIIDTGNDNLWCYSAGEHIGGDQMTEYCETYGASFGYGQ